MVVTSAASAAFDDFTPRVYFALAPVASARLHYFRSKGDRTPSRYNRHASVHAVSRRQYNRPNTAQALLCATNLAAFMYRWQVPNDTLALDATDQSQTKSS